MEQNENAEMSIEKLNEQFHAIETFEDKIKFLESALPANSQGVGGFGGSRGGGRRTFQDGVIYTLVDFYLAEYGGNKYVECCFTGSNGIGVKTSIGFWRKSVALKAGPARGNEYESTQFPFNGSDKEFIEVLQTKSFKCLSGKQISTNVEWRSDAKSYVTGKARKTWIYTFEWV
jgi:hypothetical protein